MSPSKFKKLKAGDYVFYKNMKVIVVERHSEFPDTQIIVKFDVESCTSTFTLHRQQITWKRTEKHIDCRHPFVYNVADCSMILKEDFDNILAKLEKMERKYDKLKRRHDKIGSEFHRINNLP